jgi:hypothetical protein
VNPHGCSWLTRCSRYRADMATMTFGGNRSRERGSHPRLQIEFLSAGTSLRAARRRNASVKVHEWIRDQPASADIGNNQVFYAVREGW